MAEHSFAVGVCMFFIYLFIFLIFYFLKMGNSARTRISIKKDGADTTIILFDLLQFYMGYLSFYNNTMFCRLKLLLEQYVRKFKMHRTRLISWSSMNPV